MGTTIQDGGMRERSDDDLYCPKLKLRKINKNKNIRVYYDMSQVWDCNKEHLVLSVHYMLWHDFHAPAHSSCG